MQKYIQYILNQKYFLSETIQEFRHPFGDVFACSNCSLLTKTKVCSSSNETFDSECHLEEYNCVNNDNLEVLYFGDCNENGKTGKTQFKKKFLLLLRKQSSDAGYISLFVHVSCCQYLIILT
jgi:hypothetical protein